MSSHAMCRRDVSFKCWISSFVSTGLKTTLDCLIRFWKRILFSFCSYIFSFAISVCVKCFSLFLSLQHPTQKHTACKTTAKHKSTQYPASFQSLHSSTMFYLDIIFLQECYQDYSNCNYAFALWVYHPLTAHVDFSPTCQCLCFTCIYIYIIEL